MLLQMSLAISVGSWNPPPKGLFCLQDTPGQLKAVLNSSSTSFPTSDPSKLSQDWRNNSTNPCPQSTAEKKWPILGSGPESAANNVNKACECSDLAKTWAASLKLGRGGTLRVLQGRERWCWQWGEGGGCPGNPGERPRWACKEIMNCFTKGSAILSGQSWYFMHF